MAKNILVLVPLFLLPILVFGLEASDPLCEGLPSGEIYPFPHEYNCSLFYECLNGNKKLVECPDGLYYNNRTQSCDFPDESGCFNKDPICVNVDIDYFPFPEDCSKYLECYHGDSYLMACPEGLYFNSVLKKCVIPSESDCQLTTIPPWTTPHPLCWGVRPNQIVLIPYEGDCRKYWACHGSTPELETCPVGFFFDPERQLCDFPETVNCDGHTGTPDPSTPTPPVTLTTPDQGDPRCAGTDISYWPDPIHCDKYVECFYGRTYIMDCPNELYYNSDQKKCVILSESDCGKTDTPTRGTTTERPTNWTPDPDCPYPESEGWLFPFPGDCTKFYECAEGRKVEMTCPDNLWFNNEIKECDYPYQSGCTWGTL